MKNKEILKYIKDTLKQKGAEKVSCFLFTSEKKELNASSGDISLLRTTVNKNINIVAYKDDKKGSIILNKVDENSIDVAVDQVIEMMNSAKPDPANDIAPFQSAKEITHEPLSADLDQMYQRLQEFLIVAKERYPKTILEEVILDFTALKNYQTNSNGVDFVTSKGRYSFVVVFTSKEGKKTSSFNYVSHVSKDLDMPFIEFGSIDRLLKESSEQLEPTSIEGKFVGDVIVTPESLGSFVGNVTRYISDYSLITKTSLYKDKLHQKIAHEKFNLSAKPKSGELAMGYDFTGDMFEAEDCAIIKDGVLQTFLLGLYGSNKTGFERSVNSGGSYIVDAGDTELEEMIKSTKKGIILSRFSGGSPSNNGDFSGVAKNSYYIEDGKILHPISESMVSGNVIEMFENIRQISQEQVDSGYYKFPWIKFGGLTISGK